MRWLFTIAITLLVSISTAMGNGYYGYYQPYNYVPYGYTYYPAANYNGYYYPAGYYTYTNGYWYMYGVGYIGPTTQVAVTTPAYSPGWKTAILDVAKSRDDIIAYERAITALGLPQPLQAPLQLTGRYGMQYGNNYAIPVVGSTIYGQTVQQIAQQYGTTDLNALYAQASKLAQTSQSLSGEATSQFQGLVSDAGNNAARVAEILAKGSAATSVLRAAEPAPSSSVQTSTTVIGTGQAVSQPQTVNTTPADPRVLRTTQAFYQTVAAPQCGQCHSGNSPKGGFNIANLANLDANGRRAVRIRLITNDASKRMPRTDKGAAPLNDAQLDAWMTFLSEQSTTTPPPVPAPQPTTPQ